MNAGANKDFMMTDKTINANNVVPTALTVRRLRILVQAAILVTFIDN